MGQSHIEYYTVKKQTGTVHTNVSFFLKYISNPVICKKPCMKENVPCIFISGRRKIVLILQGKEGYFVAFVMFYANLRGIMTLKLYFCDTMYSAASIVHTRTTVPHPQLMANVPAPTICNSACRYYLLCTFSLMSLVQCGFTLGRHSDCC